MRQIQTTKVNVQVNDRTDRTNVVATHGFLRRCSRLILRGACPSLAKPFGELLKRWQAMYEACAASPSLGGHRPSGGPGIAIRS